LEVGGCLGRDDTRRDIDGFFGATCAGRAVRGDAALCERLRHGICDRPGEGFFIEGGAVPGDAAALPECGDESVGQLLYGTRNRLLYAGIEVVRIRRSGGCR
jgi:hypothetical protein